MKAVFKDTTQIMVELIVDIDYDQMVSFISEFFNPDYKGNEDITSWYIGFVFVVNSLKIYFLNFYDVGNDVYCFEIEEENIGKRKNFEQLMLNFERYLNSIMEMVGKHI